MNILLTVLLIVYGALLIGIVYRNWRYTTDARGYVTARRSFTAFDIAASSTAGVVDVTSIFIMFGAVLLFGQAGAGLWVAYLFATVVIAVLTPWFYRAVREHDVWTFTDFFRAKFGTVTEKVFTLVSSIFVLGFIVGLYSANLTLFEHFFGIGPWWATGIAFLITLGYVLLTGFRGLVRTDVLQYAIMLVLLLTAVLTFPNPVGFSEVANVPAWFVGAFWLVAPVAFFQNIVKPHAWQPIIGATSEATAKRGAWLAVLLNAMLVVPFIWMAFSFAEAFPNANPNQVLLTGLESAFPPYASALVFVGLLGALMSSLDVSLFYLGSNVARNLLPHSWSRNFNDLTIIRSTIAALSIVTMLLALTVEDFVSLGLNVLPLMGVAAIPFVLSLFTTFRGINASGAIGMLVGAAVFAYIFSISPENYLVNVIPALISGGIVILGYIVSFFLPENTGATETVAKEM